MPKRTTPHLAGTRQYYHNCSFELLCAHWFAKTGWQVFTPIFDHGHHTDLIVSDGPKCFRVQVKTVGVGSNELEIENKWKGGHVNYVALFARNSSWGSIFPAFAENRRKLSEVGGTRFQLKHASFMKAFHTLA